MPEWKIEMKHLRSLIRCVFRYVEEGLGRRDAGGREIS